MILVMVGVAQATQHHVATTGDNSDAGTLEAPWATFAHGIYNAQAGDTVYIHGGTYVQTYTIVTRGNYYRATYGGDPDETNNNEAGTEENPVIIRNYPGETPIIDCDTANILINHQGMPWWIWKGLTFINANTVLSIGGDGKSQHNTVDSLIIHRNRGGDNKGAISCGGVGGAYGVINNCYIKGPGWDGIHLNTCGIYCAGIEVLTITNCVIDSTQIGIYFKHRNEGADSTDIEIAYNFMRRCHRLAAEFNSRKAYIHDNIFGDSCGGVLNCETNGAAGGDLNTYDHNTFNCNLTLGADTESGDAYPGSYQNVITNNLFLRNNYIHPYFTSPTHGTTLDYNCWKTGIYLQEYNTQYSTLEDWKTHYGQDANSVTGSIVFSPPVDSPLTAIGYTLGSSSAGYGTGESGTDIGARVNLFGTGPIARIRNHKITCTGSR
jgi:hypothetical protein